MIRIKSRENAVSDYMLCEDALMIHLHVSFMFTIFVAAWCVLWNPVPSSWWILDENRSGGPDPVIKNPLTALSLAIFGTNASFQDPPALLQWAIFYS